MAYVPLLNEQADLLVKKLCSEASSGAPLRLYEHTVAMAVCLIERLMVDRMPRSRV